MTATAVLLPAAAPAPVAPTDVAAGRRAEQARVIARTRALLSEVSALLTMDHPNVVKVGLGGNRVGGMCEVPQFLKAPLLSVDSHCSAVRCSLLLKPWLPLAAVVGRARILPRTLQSSLSLSCLFACVGVWILLPLLGSPRGGHGARHMPRRWQP
jgi:hypothetical protein